MFENKLINGIHVSRYIASYAKVCVAKKLKFKMSKFIEWLHLLGLKDEDVHYIYNYMTNGKLELENNAEKFLTEN